MYRDMQGSGYESVYIYIYKYIHVHIKGRYVGFRLVDNREV